nr:hypothetical protein [Bacilli bacterium]
MMHPLYSNAVRCMGQPVYVYHVNGFIYRGFLTQVLPAGIYLTQCRAVASYVTMQIDTENSEQIFTDNPHALRPRIDLVFIPGAYFAFGALAGLGIGLAASAFW